jgi:CRISPR-associated protein Cas6/Cse3/CasE subtype I-E
MKNKLNRVDYEGVLEVTDREKFRHAFYNGIGSAKSMGFGMLIIQAIL